MSMMNYPAVDVLIDTMNRQRSVDQFQTRFNLPFQNQLNLGGLLSAETRIPGSTQALDAAIQSMYLPTGIQGTQRVFGLGIPSTMGTMGTSNVSQYPLGQRYGLGASACAPGITCAPGCSPLEWNQTFGNMSYGSGLNQNLGNVPYGSYGWNQARGNVFTNQNLGNVPYGSYGWNQNLINQNSCFAPFGSQFGSSQTDILGRQFSNQPLSQGFSPFYHQDILSGATDCPIKTTCGQLAYQQPTPQSQKILHGLLLDKLEGLRATNWVEDALSLLKGQRSTDQIWNLLASGVAVDPMIVAQAIKVDRTVDFKVADIIQNICNYRRRNSEAVHVSEHLMSGKVYDGPIFNSVKEQSKIAAMNVAKNQLIDLYALYGRI